MNLRRSVFALAAVLALAMFAPQAHAALELSLSTNGAIGSAATVLITDGGAGDGCALTDCIQWSGSIGDWFLTVNLAEDKSVSAPLLMHLNSIDNHAASATPSTLTIAMSDSNFTPATAGVNSHIGGTLSNGGTFTSTAYFDGTNAATGLFNTTGTNLGTLAGGPPSFSSDLSHSTPFTSPYALTVVTAMSFGAAQGNGSFDSTLDPVPEPSSVALLGGVLLATATAIRRKMKRS